MAAYPGAGCLRVLGQDAASPGCQVHLASLRVLGSFLSHLAVPLLHPEPLSVRPAAATSAAGSLERSPIDRLAGLLAWEDAACSAPVWSQHWDSLSLSWGSQHSPCLGWLQPTGSLIRPTGHSERPMQAVRFCSKAFRVCHPAEGLKRKATMGMACALGCILAISGIFPDWCTLARITNPPGFDICAGHTATQPQLSVIRGLSYC